MLKRMMLLAGAALAIVAFAAPAAASASTWTVNGGALPEADYPVTGTGSISATGLNGALHIKCNVHTKATLKAGGKAEVWSFTITTPCPVVFTPEGSEPICEVTEAGTSASEENPWQIHTSGLNMEITEAQFFDVFNAGCPLGAGVEASGTATATFDNETSNVVLNEAGDLTGATGAVKLNGEVHFEGAEGAVITLDE